MSVVAISIHQGKTGRMRPLNVLRDRSAVADLLALCFRGTMEGEAHFLNQAVTTPGGGSVPPFGYVWEENGKVIGNVSLIPFNHKGQKTILIANVAVHPDHRRRGIACSLTERAVRHAHQRHVDSIWLHVRDDNPSVIKMYTELGFRERTRRTYWQAVPGLHATQQDVGFTISPRHAHFWPQQRAWLERIYPDEMSWYRSPNWDVLSPGIWNWLYRLFVDYDVRQWAALKDGRLQGVLAWLPTYRAADLLWVAIALDAAGDALTTLLLHARRHLAHRRALFVEYPGGQAVEAFLAAGFSSQRTLIWMRADGATQAGINA